jgi:3'-phosphoadenosine 5'-phosphosulfate sulfotransferase (PAPS reductase)/FAD synthetase
MLEVERAEVQRKVVEAVYKFSAKRLNSIDTLLKDTGINGYDSIEFVEHLEDEFKIDLEEISPYEAGAVAPALTVDQLIDLISIKLAAKRPQQC